MIEDAAKFANDRRAREGSHAAKIAIETSYGRLIAEIFAARAPATAAHFLRLIDDGNLQAASFYRAVRPDNDERLPKIRVIQGGLDPTTRQLIVAPVEHESTKQTGLSHVDGTLSMVRWTPGSATSEFFIVVGDTPALDCGGTRHPDGQGFAAFGRVVAGMDIVRRINMSPTGAVTDIEYLRGQALAERVAMRIARIPAQTA